MVTPSDISAVLGETMTKNSGTGPTCSYVNAATTDIVTVSTSQHTPEGARQALSGITSGGGAVVTPASVGDQAVLSTRSSVGQTSALCAFAKGGSVVVILVSGPKVGDSPKEAVALAQKAAGRL